MVKDNFKMGVYKNGELEDYGTYDSIEEAKQDFYNWDKPKGRTAIIESEEGEVIELK